MFKSCERFVSIVISFSTLTERKDNSKSKASVPPTLGFLNARRRAGLVIASAALIVVGGLSILVTLRPKPAGAAGEGSHPGIVRIPLDTKLTERAVYPP